MCDEDKPIEISSDEMSDSSDEECEGESLAHTCFLSKAIEKQFLNENTSDIVLVVEQQRFYVHKIILAARSEYFNALFYGALKESKQSEIELHEIAAEPFKLVLKYAYSSKIKLENLKVKTIVEILELARRYMVENLETGICDYLKEIISEGNVCFIWDHAIMFQMANLAKICIKYAENNAEEILEDESFLNLSATTLIEILALDSFCADEITIFRAVRKWIEKHKPEKVENILCHVRLPLIATTYLVKEVKSSTLFSESALLSAIDAQTHWKYEEINYRKIQIFGKNIAFQGSGAKVIHGNKPEFLLVKNRGYTWHAIQDKRGITIQLKKPYEINSIRMLLRDVDKEVYSYYVNVSVDGKKWFRVIDNQHKDCSSHQTLSFPPTIAKLIKIVGTRSSAGKTLCIQSFECSFNDK